MSKLGWYRLGFIVTAVIAGLLAVRFAASDGASFATAPDVAWAAPTQKALNNLGSVLGTGNDRRYDCMPLTYRIHGDFSKTTQTGCFVPAAFGMVDQDQSTVIFNGTDEAEQIRYGGQPAPLGALPYSAAMVRFGGFPIAGTYMYMYRSFTSALDNGGNLLGIRWKEITALPDFTVTDPAGQPLAVNPQALAYAARGQWMVTESPNHALVRVNLATFSVLPFAPSFANNNPTAAHEASMAITEDGRYVAVASNEYATLRVYDLKTCTVASTADVLAPQKCQSHDYWPYVKDQATTSLRSVSHLSFVNDELLSLQATTSSGTETYLLSPKGAITSLIPYLGLGDSYASGQGAFNYLAGTDTAINHCHLSVHSYPLLLNGDLFGNKGHSVACSGAVAHDIGSQSGEYTGQSTDQRTAAAREADGSEVSILHDFTPGYLAQQNFITSYQPGVITVQVGGNNVGFNDMLLRCVSPVTALKNLSLNPNSCYQSYEDRLEVEQTINRSYSTLVQLYKQLQRQSPSSRIYVVGYPQIVSPKADCRVNVRMTSQEIQFARDVTNYLNGVIYQASKAAGIQYIDVSNALQGHELCSGGNGGLAVNGLTAGTDAIGVLGQESYHPNALGHQLLEQAILQASHNLTSGPVVAQPTQPRPDTASDDPLLQAPKTGRQTSNIIPATDLVAGRGTIGGTITLRITGTDADLRPNTNYTVRLGDTLVIGTAHSDDLANIHVTITIPSTANPGPQPVSVNGQSQNDTPVTVVQIIYVNNSPTDYDGDGIPNDQDSCPLVRNSGIDQDNDGLDDACDSSIDIPVTNPLVTPPVSGQTTNPTTTSPATPEPISTPATVIQPGQPATIMSPTTASSILQPNTAGAQSGLLSTTHTFNGAAIVSRALIKTVTTGRQQPRLVTHAGPSTSAIHGVKKPVFASVIRPASSPKLPLQQFTWYLWVIIWCGLLLALYVCRLLS